MPLSSRSYVQNRDIKNDIALFTHHQKLCPNFFLKIDATQVLIFGGQ